MGRRYPEGGVEQGEAVLADLARHPATAEHVAFKLARHFVADTPPPALVDKLKAVFLESDGDLQAVTLALLRSDEAWAAPAIKIRTPQEYLWSSIRALQADVTAIFVSRSLLALGQPLWNPPSPEGYSDLTAEWLAPDALTNRLDLAERIAGFADAAYDPRSLAPDILGPAISPATTEAIERAESPVQAYALLLMSPEFQRR
jgi:uncharacterized protein (DUF1800 family)